MDQERYVLAVYKDVMKHIEREVQRFGTRSMSFSTWEDVRSTVTNETFTLQLFQVDRVKLDELVDVCRRHKCFVNASVRQDGRECFIDLLFLWVDPDDPATKTKRRHTHAHSHQLGADANPRPSFTKLFALIGGSMVNVALWYGKVQMFG